MARLQNQSLTYGCTPVVHLKSTGFCFTSISHQGAAKFLAYYHGFVHTGGFSGYNRFSDITRCGCWAHLRRYTSEAILKKKGSCSETSEAYTGYSYCNQLFQIEKELKDLEPEERQKKRLELERPVLDAFWKWTNGINPLADQSLPRQLTMPKTKDHIWRITFLMEDAPLVITQLKEP